VIENSPVIARWIHMSIVFGAGLFILALAVSAALIPQLRFLHLFQAIIYVAIIVLSQRNSPWGFGFGIFVPVVWNCLNLFVTHLIEAGAAQLWLFLRTGHVSRPDTLMVMIGGVAHFILIAACLVGFLRLRPDKKKWSRFIAGGFLSLAYFALIIVILAPR